MMSEYLPMMLLLGDSQTVYVVEEPLALAVVVVVVVEAVFVVVLPVDLAVGYLNELDSSATQLCDMLDMFVVAGTMNASSSCEICGHMVTF